MKIVFYIILYFILIQESKSQVLSQNLNKYYDFTYNAAQSEWYDNNPQKAIQYLDSAELYSNLKPYQFLLRADCYIEIGDTMKALNEIKK